MIPGFYSFKGKFSWPDGIKCEGEFKDGEPKGYGKREQYICERILCSFTSFIPFTLFIEAKFLLPDGSSVEGEFNGSILNG